MHPSQKSDQASTHLRTTLDSRQSPHDVLSSSSLAKQSHQRVLNPHSLVCSYVRVQDNILAHPTPSRFFNHHHQREYKQASKQAGQKTKTHIMSVAQNDSTVDANGGMQMKEAGSGYANGESNGYQSGSKLEGGQTMTRTITPGGHVSNDDLLAIGAGHRKLANPLPLGAWSFATTTLVLSLFNVGVQGIPAPNAVLTFSLFYGGFTQYLAGLWEFASGNTLGATIFVCYGMFWWGFSFIFIPFFGEMGTYNGVPGVYSMGGTSASEADNAIGLYLFIWFGITLLLTFAAARSSVVLIVLLVLLDITFVLLGAFYYTGNAKLQTAGGAFGIATAFVAYYLGLGSFLSKDTSYFTVPLFSLAVKD